MKTTIAVLAGLALATASPCLAREKISIYVGYSYYFPTASSTQDAFGHAWPQLTAGRFERRKPERWGPTYDLASFRRDDSYRADLFPLTAGIQRAIGSHDSRDVQPYVALRAGPYYGRVKAEAAGVSETRIGLNANASLGVVIQERYFVEGRYDHFGHLAGYNLDGFSLCAGVRVLDF
jgi:hypothetical protein